MKRDRWILIATNEQGAKVFAKEATRKAVINRFDNTYSRSGFKIMVSRNDTNAPETYIKTTYR